MRLSILQKMLVAMLIISVVPPITLGYCASIDAKALGLSASRLPTMQSGWGSTLVSVKYYLAKARAAVQPPGGDEA